MGKVYIIGVGMIRFNKYPDKTVISMAHEAIDLALKDAGLTKEDLDAIFFSNTFWGMFDNQHSIRGEVVMRHMGVGNIPVTNVENACAGGSTALHLAYTGIRAGIYDVAMAVGSEKITNPNKMLSLSAYGTCMDVGNFEKHIQNLMEISKTFTVKIPADQSAPGEGRSIFMDAYAMGARWHMSRFNSTQQQLAVICAKNHLHGSLNPLSQYQQVMTAEEVLADKMVAYPLTRAMCAPVGDGSAATIICSEKFLKKLTAARPVHIRASVLGTGADRDLNAPDIGERLAKQAYNMAGVGPEDIGLAELHDATSWGELHQTESMGFCPMGEGGPFAESGATTLGGKKPINTSGGLECKGHPIGASGLSQIHELVMQLRSEAGKRQVEGAKIGLAENGGGNIGVEEAAMCIHILEKM
ncbi:MAG: thiolase family protein [Deltaproteobacteria bacterium]|nr:MAG: thiolase family protein [Deltaproteobacteria bacterium]